MIIASDCKGVVNDIKEGTGGQYASIIKEINLMSTQIHLGVPSSLKEERQILRHIASLNTL